MNFASKLKILRSFYGFSQAELATKVNLHQSDISAMESGKMLPSPIIKQRLETAFNLTFDNPIVITPKGDIYNQPSLPFCDDAA